MNPQRLFFQLADGIRHLQVIGNPVITGEDVHTKYVAIQNRWETATCMPSWHTYHLKEHASGY